jgi:hypothetical protein
MSRQYEENPLTMEEIEGLAKAELLEVAKYYLLPAKQYMRKGDVKEMIVKHLVSETLLPESALESLDQAGSDFVLEMKKLEIKERELDIQRAKQEGELELQRVKQEREQELRKWEIERDRERDERHMQLELKKLELQAAGGHLLSHAAQHAPMAFDVSKHVRLVPRFQETDVDTYFLHFEKVASSLKWPEEVWTILLQSVLTGRAAEAYAALGIVEGADYQVVKKAILKTYELVPEAYRQKFRTCRKQDGQTHVEFSREKEVLFDRWCSSKEVKEFGELRQLVLLEEFKKCVHGDVKTHLDEQKVNDVAEAAVIADDYALTHKGASKYGPSPKGGSQGAYFKPNQGKPFYGQSGFPKQQPLENTDKKSGQTPDPKWKGQSSGPICFYCKKKGHVMSECWVLKNKNKSNIPTSQAKPTGLATVRPRPGGVSQRCTALEESKELKSESFMDEYLPFISEGFVSLEGDNATLQPVKILRDTGASQSLLLEGILPLSEKSSAGASVLVQGVELGFVDVPLHVVNLKSDIVTGRVTIGVRPCLPVEGISLILGNDLAKGKVLANPCVTEKPSTTDGTEQLQDDFPGIFPACAVTRAMAKKVPTCDTEDDDMCLTDTFFGHIGDVDDDKSHSSVESKTPDVSTFCGKQGSPVVGDGEFGQSVLSKERLIVEQEKDPELQALAEKAHTLVEALEVPVCYYKQGGVLMRKWRPSDVPADNDWKVVRQIVVPAIYRHEVLSLAHDTPLAGHLGVRKTYDRISNHFYWPRIRRDVSEFCKSCHTCQVVGKPNQTIPVAPLYPIPAFEEPFSKVIVDCVGPLPKTKSGNEYLLTIMCASTRFPEAIPLRKITAPVIVKALIKFFTFVGLPKSVQSDQGSNFMSGIFQQVMHQLGIRQYKSSAYHPQSQGALERFHQTLKNMIKAYCYDCNKDWDEGVHLLLFAARESVQESLGFSPFELVFGHTVRGPLQLLKEKWLNDESETNLLDYVSTFRFRLLKACEVARKNLGNSQKRMKTWYDQDAKLRTFSPGEKVLVLFPIPGQPLRARYYGPCTVESKVSDLDYIVATPDRRKPKQLCHVNMLKEYHDRGEQVAAMPVTTVSQVGSVPDEEVNSSNPYDGDLDCDVGLKNSDVLANLDKKLCHLTSDQRKEITDLIQEYVHLFPDVPSRTDLAVHDVDVGDARPVKQHSYRMNPVKLGHLRKEVDYMLENDIIEPSHSEWSSPCLLVPKPDGSFRFCTDFRKVNALSRSDSYPIPRIDDCIDKVGSAKYVTKFDLLKGYWQVPLTDRAKDVSAFVTPDGLYQYKVMPFGMKNAPATFQRLVNEVIAGLEGCEAYMDDVIISSDSWLQHLQQIRAFFDRLTHATLTINLLKSEFVQAFVVFLGHVVGQGQVRPVEAKVECIVNFPVPTGRKELMRFLGMAGYYRKFCQNFSDVASPLTNLLSKNQKFVWTSQSQEAFEKVKAILTNAPVLAGPDFTKPFKLVVDASDVGAGAVLVQEGKLDVDHPVCYYSKKFNKHQKNYSTVEKEALALLLALQHFEVYVSAAQRPIVVYTDHNPLTFLDKMKNKNQRLMRWSLFLQEYDVEIRHIRGKDNVIADALSRV